jgi:FMN phosphatase YigB (HAD superfamily)
MKYLLTDVDGVLLDWLSSFKEFIVAKGLQTRPGEPHDWKLEHWIRGATQRSITDLVIEFNETPAFGKLKPYGDALTYLKVFCSKGYKIVAITACSSEPQVAKARIDNLNNCFGSNIFTAIHCLDLGCGKADVLDLYPPSIWVEDRWEYAIAGANIGHRTFIIDRPHNQGTDSRITRVQDWVELYRSII